MTDDLVRTAPAALRCWRWLPELLRPGRIYVGPTGEQLVARADGALDEVLFGGRPHAGAAADPSNSGRPRRRP